METPVEKNNCCQKRKKFVIGSIVVIAGLFLLGFNFDILPYAWKHIIFSWQMLLIVI